MKQLSIIVSGLMAIVFTACTNEDIGQEKQEPTAGQLITVKAYAAGEDAPDTRIAQTWEGNVMKLSWSDSDKFSVIRGGDNNTFTRFTEEGANDFIGSLPTAGSGNYYAAYPVTKGTDHTAVSFDISKQDDDLPYLMYAASESGDSYQFHHAVAYLKATFTNDLKGKTATITLTLPAGVYADGTIDLATGTLSGGSKQNITKTVTFSAESTEVLLAIPPMESNNKTLQFLVTEGTNNYVATLAGNAEKAIEAGNYYTATITLTEATPCNLPDGNAFREAIKAFLDNNSTLTKIAFIANSTTTSDNQIGSSGAYLVANTETSTLEIHTAADVFVFPANCSRMFYGSRDRLSSITAIHFNDCINTAAVTNMSYMFEHCQALTSLDVSNFNTAEVTTMSYMFNYCEALTSLNVSSFNTAKVTNMNHMFANCKALTSLDVTNFNTAKVTDMGFMFYSCYVLTSLDVTNFNTANVTNMGFMFTNCRPLTSLDVSSFNTEKVTDMSAMFRECYALTSLDVTNFNTANVTDMSNMFNNCLGLTSIAFGNNFNTANVTTMRRMFSNCIALTSLNVSSFNTAKVTDMEGMFYNCKALTELDLCSFTFSDVTSFDMMFEDTGSSAATKPISIYVKSAADKATLTNASTNINSSSATIVVPCNLPGYNYTYGNAFANVINDVLNYESSSINKIKFIAKSDNTNFYTPIAGSGAYVVPNGTTLEIHTAADVFVFPANCSYMFSGYDNTGYTGNNCFSRITSIDFNNCVNTAEVTNMSQMFSACSKLTSLDLSSFNTAKVMNMSHMFQECSALTSLDLSSFTFNATDYASMFLSTGSSVANGPILIYVKDETDKTTLEGGNTYINNSYAVIKVISN